MAPTWVNVMLAVVSLIVLCGLVGLFFWLMEGWITPGVSWVLLAIGIGILFVVFTWIIFIALGIVATLIAGIVMSSDSAKDPGQ